jgi:hypothetical protein
MTAGFVLAKAANADGLEKGHHSEKFDDLTAFRRFHLLLVMTAKYRKTDLVVPILRNEVGGGGKQGKPEIKVVSALPILAPYTPRNMACRADPNALVGLSLGAVAIRSKGRFHDGTNSKGDCLQERGSRRKLYRKAIGIKQTMVTEQNRC